MFLFLEKGDTIFHNSIWSHPWKVSKQLATATKFAFNFCYGTIAITHDGETIWFKIFGRIVPPLQIKSPTLLSRWNILFLTAFAVSGYMADSR